MLLLLMLSACSPLYVMRAAWEESQILLSRRPLSEIEAAAETQPETARKIRLVMRAREAAPALGLEIDGNFSTYSAVNRPVLVWVLSAAPKTALRPVTWWFPVVGSVPYKGFFERADALDAAHDLEIRGYDTMVRGSIAYSTLGWFDDPLLSTMLALDDVALVDTVFHELTHTTLWVPGSAEFNETFANFVGAQAGAIFFAEINSGLAQTARARWEDERRFGSFLEQAAARLEPIYSALDAKTPTDDVLFNRRRALWVLGHRWKELLQSMQTTRYTAQPPLINNAAILAHRAYLKGIPEFERLFEACSHSLPRFIAVIRELVHKSGSGRADPYDTLRRHSGCEIPNQGVERR